MAAIKSLMFQLRYEMNIGPYVFEKIIENTSLEQVVLMTITANYNNSIIFIELS